MVDFKYNAKKNPKNKPSIFILHFLIYSSGTNSTNIYPSKNIFGFPKCKYAVCTGVWW